jgi:hypothetical protein
MPVINGKISRVRQPMRIINGKIRKNPKAHSVRSEVVVVPKEASARCCRLTHRVGAALPSTVTDDVDRADRVWACVFVAISEIDGICDPDVRVELAIAVLRAIGEVLPQVNAANAGTNEAVIID